MQITLGQVDFGKGPTIIDVFSDNEIKTSLFTLISLKFVDNSARNYFLGHKKGTSKILQVPVFTVVRPAGFEPAAFSSGG